MSRVYWHSPSGDAELKGGERHYAAHVVNELVASQLPTLDGGGWGKVLFPLTNHYREWNRSDVVTHVFNGFGSRCVEFGDLREEIFDMVLNTSIALGSDPVVLLARMHGQCEIHGWVAGHNRNWLAEIIERGRKHDILRSGMGWESVAELLRSRDDEPVVTSYSVCESFPDAYWVLGHQDREFDADWESERAVEELGNDHERLWKEALDVLTQDKESTTEWSPEIWHTHGFRNGLSLFDFKEAVLDSMKKGNRK